MGGVRYCVVLDFDIYLFCLWIDCSEEEERLENEALLKLMTTAMPHARTKKDRDLNAFEAEMEAELDRRAQVVESAGGVEHQKSLSRSSSTSSLNMLGSTSSPSQSPAAGSSSGGPRKSSSLKGSGKRGAPSGAKSVRFMETGESSASGSGGIPAPEAEQKAAEGENEPKKDFYEDIYFDSEESEGEDEETKRKRKQKRSLLSNDDLLYDPESDAKDQAWVDKRRRKYFSAATAGGSSTSTSSSPSAPSPPAPTNNKQPLPTSDAVLNCPGCFTTLCLDCQRHEFYTGQYRAMFVMNCLVNKEETLRVPVKQSKGRGKRQAPPQTPTFQSDSDSRDIFNPVKCQVCDTQVAVYDTDEVYHFFNVLASHS
jgi:hypothetical protein